ncbi:hypothetical protein [Burkholderia oklahomensis]|nr:hypothetical protein [Burkholderia oklahomensis]AOI40859.1 hypothetical protein WG70_13940 [Burkholderia oklahomensis EO147]AOI44462.1 hypothetical protein WI23_00770 [Burkholderia oklahomensis C6786]KUY55425.1 hypothetical protein WG70_11320 [Burkholderia oklahomensis EO147]KUY61527.1 hypothetical protein WI23_10060 [Burkholderia oklahomensis C6786]MBI0359546.1 hypothetical protein [Burkholderia oklahomensis]
MVTALSTIHSFEMMHATIARIVVGDAGLDIEEGHNDIAQAWNFLDSQIPQHESDVAIAIVRDDGTVFGAVWNLGDFHCFAGTKDHLRTHLRSLRFYSGY